MASEIKVNNIKRATGTTITLGESGDTVALACGASATGFGLSWCSSVKTAAFCAAAGNGYFINTCGGAFEVTLPGSASVGDQINFTDFARTWGTACKELTLNQNSLKFQGNTTPKPEYDTTGATVKIVYSGATQGWIPQLDKDTALETPQTVAVQYLVVAGGAGGGYDRGGGGGAGGQRYVASKSMDLTKCTTYPVTVGAGGGGGPATPSPICRAGFDGDNSVFNAITSAGGGGGAASCSAGRTGGSGGGSGGGASPVCGGAGNTPPTPCTQGNPGGNAFPPSPPGYQSGGGGGGGTAGANGCGPSGPGGPGGDGKPTAILATPTVPSYGTPGPAPGQYFAGGGGGSGYTSTAGTGGAGGGGDSNATGAGDAGTVNTGGGGGADAGPGPGGGGGGGSGIVILRRTTASSTSTSGNVVTVCGSDTVHIFTGDGTFVA